jgi:hypothetical protein
VAELELAAQLPQRQWSRVPSREITLSCRTYRGA